MRIAAWASWTSTNEPLAEMLGVPADEAAGVPLLEALASLASSLFCLLAEILVAMLMCVVGGRRGRRGWWFKHRVDE